METSAVIMMLFGLVITWGGAAVCISIALKRKNF
ncbi:Putative methionine and alanine importer, small subunit [Desulfocicer vacuolatum DSM 3385]|uniref:Putative methionine and alanine importer, small subunit n=1 Tax=Desulfocicer vacuolatum DSM 3385 TaxID=1121400 RepID=A0A1W2ED37_9BACT|nr:methionine/alanine import family NSS transporter small subunit [Desulfocicer vacuolatum]SMD07670.1 Putative methionine and alanine importer, small subunit [Desulfocicer vacuolatum DSM 3385]